MAYLAKGHRQDLLEQAETLDITIQDNFKVLDIKEAILKSEVYDADFAKECLNRIISDRKELELRSERDKENQRIYSNCKNFKLKLILLQLQTLRCCFLQTPICQNDSRLWYSRKSLIPRELIILKNTKGNRTLLGIDFLTAADIVLDLQRKQWYFTETFHRKYNFVKAPTNINALLIVDPEPHPCQLRENEGKHLSLQQWEEINSLLEKYEECFQPGFHLLNIV
ncbi:uncharacterized protein TNCV_2977911 [Trichonephila clavipes]|nr:uncharacterized protein TNCV_2977911 [Trichonephila clavipes]